MTRYAMSQSSSVERRLKIERGGQGIVLTFIDHVGNKERKRIMVQAEDLMAAATSPPPAVGSETREPQCSAPGRPVLDADFSCG